jgi:hypothetical protein
MPPPEAVPVLPLALEPPEDMLPPAFMPPADVRVPVIPPEDVPPENTPAPPPPPVVLRLVEETPPVPPFPEPAELHCHNALLKVRMTRENQYDRFIRFSLSARPLRRPREAAVLRAGV